VPEALKASRAGPGERTVDAKGHVRRDRGVMAGVGVGEDRLKGHGGTDNRRADGPEAKPANGRPHPSHRGDGYAGTGGGGAPTGGDEAPGGDYDRGEPGWRFSRAGTRHYRAGRESSP